MTHVNHVPLARGWHTAVHPISRGFPGCSDRVPVEGRAVDTDRPTASSAVFLGPAKRRILLLDFSVFRRS